MLDKIIQKIDDWGKIIVVLFVVVAVCDFFFNDSKIIDILDKITICFAFVSMCYIWLQYYKMQQKIKIILLINDKQQELPLTILRRHFTRAEILGVLGVFDKNSDFRILHTATQEFFDDIQAVQLGKKDEIIIPIKKENDDKYEPT